MRRRFGPAAAAALAVALAFQPAEAQRPPPEHPVFGYTLMSGSGFIATPHAFVAPSTLFGSTVAIVPDDFGTQSFTVTRASAGITLAKFLEVGSTIHDVDAYSLFAKLQVVRQQGIFPAIAVGFQNLTTTGRGRFGIEDPFYDGVEDAISPYGVATYVAGPGGRKFPSWVVISVGWGGGLFSRNNPAIEDDNLSGGFGAVALDFQAAERAFVRAIVEYDGYDINMAVMADLAGLEVMAGALSVDESDKTPQPLIAGEPFDPTRTFQGIFYNQIKPFVSVALDFRALGALPWVFGGGGGAK